MFRPPISLIAGGASVTQTFTSNTLIGNLWTYMGSPADSQDVTLIVDGADIGNLQITADWNGGSTFTIQCINGGRILGLGGDGGNGAPDFGSTGEAGERGSDGSPAITADGFTINLDIDDGYLLGGGGGGGGGSYTDTGTDGDGGGGGGGGQGYSVTSGGAGGTPYQGFPAPSAGGNGSSTGPGSGGAAGGVSSTSDGGAGGVWGSGGQAGRSSNVIGGTSLFYYGGTGGRGGAAFSPANGATLNINGAKSEATLRSEGRIKGDSAAVRPAFNRTNWVVNVVQAVAGANETGVIFELNGNLSTGNLSGTPTVDTTKWLSATDPGGIAALYEIRERGSTGDSDGTWSNRVNVTPGTWSTLGSSDRQQSINSGAGSAAAGTLIEIRRADLPAGSPDTDIICCFFVRAVDTN